MLSSSIKRILLKIKHVITGKINKRDIALVYFLKQEILRVGRVYCNAVFHESKNVLKLLLSHGGDPNIRSSYNKNAWDLAKDELDAANNIVRSKAEIRSVLVENDTTKLQIYLSVYFLGKSSLIYPSPS